MATSGKFSPLDLHRFNCRESPGGSVQVSDRRLHQARVIIEHASELVELVDLVIDGRTGLDVALQVTNPVTYRACPTRRQVSTGAPRACR
ncbi:hypothetical protein OI25_2980 [Paraburkholderia fungorum]|uniref:Uncharacterized protein n=1 Tax=Paraburkholderia fungorum TaxID=134537 RepID=A0AAU8SWP6_9BURK|nr:hypothetical protein OI25_2980 [Paraburkholderia fungorum]